MRLLLKRASVILVITILCSVMLLTAFGCSAASTPSVTGGILRIGEIADAASPGYPAKLMRVSSNRIAAAAVETLFVTDATGNSVPWLVKDYKADAASNTITMNLVKGIKFHDGTDFNAAAVKWNLEQCMTTKIPGTQAFKSVNVVDDYTVRLDLTQWDSTALTNLTQTLGMMISPTACEKNGVDWAQQNPVGTGPYQFVSWQKETKVTFKKFASYWQKDKPFLDGLEFIPILDSLTRQMSFRAGELDLMLTNDAKSIAPLEKMGFAISRKSTGSGANGLVFDSKNTSSPFAKLEVRQAVSYAINTDQINKGVFDGQFEPANQLIYKGHWGYNSDIKGYPYDPNKAKQMLAAAGYANGFKTKILFIGIPDFKECYTAVQGYLKAVGIEAELDGAEIARFQKTVWAGGTWEGMAMGPSTTNPDLAAMLFTRCNGGSNFYTQMLIPDDYSKAIKASISATSFDDKKKFTQEAMKLMIDKYALQSPVYCMSDFAVAQKYVRNHGFEVTPNGAQWTPHEIWMDKK